MTDSKEIAILVLYHHEETTQKREMNSHGINDIEINAGLSLQIPIYDGKIEGSGKNAA